MEFEHVTFDLPHGTFHALQGGDPDGQPTVVLHGFPDHPPTAKPFLAELARRGRRVVAPWLRGYAPSPTAGPFDFASLTGDVLALIDRWSPGRAVELVGHDWGAMITYDAVVTAPERIERAVALAIPHPLTFLSRPRPAQLRRSWYMALFQLPGSGWMASARDLALIDRLWRQWSPGFSLDPALQAELHEHLRVSMPAPIKYYREMMRPGMLKAARRLSQPIEVPLLHLHGADDDCILPPQVDDRHRFAAPHAMEVVPDVGHFLHIEAPEAIAERIAAWAEDHATLTARPPGSATQNSKG
ncbi:pimeloyl-ACP methyl ester carboxylesterase [Promicromonospora sp. AC04]|uniref:alpha/beta fold hydrolase n=1 Tax=Promicromonospora sp. AC04 TaxID=2135723 RepID=UPI000D3D534E|nr:alpha/beta hydrolase [Promicromonospora sp. AC04]PUB31852.1 pimeloyl-ACP methyl ester carboxylesterase [Promicromonospora sp. AC04]